VILKIYIRIRAHFCSCRCFWLLALLSGPVLLSLMHTSLPHPVVFGMGTFIYGYMGSKHDEQGQGIRTACAWAALALLSCRAIYSAIGWLLGHRHGPFLFIISYFPIRDTQTASVSGMQFALSPIDVSRVCYRGPLASAAQCCMRQC